MRTVLRTAICVAVLGFVIGLPGLAVAQETSQYGEEVRIERTDSGEKIVAFEYYSFTREGQNYSLEPGQTFESSGDTYKITDANGQVIAEGFTDGRPSAGDAAQDPVVQDPVVQDPAVLDSAALGQAALGQAAQERLLLAAGVGVAVAAVLGVVVTVVVRMRRRSVDRGGPGQAVPEPAAPRNGAPGGVAPGWYPDPLGRHQHRYWGGAVWTGHVATGGLQSVDPLEGTPVPDAAASAEDLARSDGHAQVAMRDEAGPRLVLPAVLKPLLDEARNAYELWNSPRSEFFAEDAEATLEQALHRFAVCAMSAGMAPDDLSAMLRRGFPKAVGREFFERVVSSDGGHRYEAAPVAADPRLVGINGWLILPAIGLVISPVLAVVGLLGSLAALSTEQAAGRLGLVVAGGFVQFALLILMVFAAFRFFGKKADAPRYMMAMYGFALIASVQTLVMALTAGTVDASGAALFEVVRGGVVAGIWITYFATSKRVKATFVG